MSDSVRPHRQQPTRLPRPWDSPGKNTGVGCHFLLQCMKVISEIEVTQSSPTLRNSMNCSLPGSSIHGIFPGKSTRVGCHHLLRLNSGKLVYIWMKLISTLNRYDHNSPLDCKEIKLVNPKGNQPWIFIGRTDAEAPKLWSPDANSQLTGKDPDAGKDWRQQEKGAAEDVMVR